jgi:hypothetical protein
MAGIPTTHRRVNFRSRLEARWAVMFDLLGWPWEYEPIDLEGYIPDFVLPFPHPLLVEVKPAFSEEELHEATGKIDASSWAGEAVVLGARLFGRSPGGGSGIAIGILREEWKTYIGLGDDRHFVSDHEWVDASVAGCLAGHPSLSTEIGGWSCRVCDGASYRDYHHPNKGWYHGKEPDVHGLWAEAGNRVQWRPQPR